MTLVEPPLAPCWAGVRFDEAQALLATAAAPLGTETVALRKAGRRVLADPVRAALDSPRQDAAAMDGVAVRDADLRNGVRRLPVAGAAYAGAPFAGNFAGTAVRITTGAPLPAGADRVVPVELLTHAEGWVALPDTLPAKRHVRPRASDFAAGSAVLAAGRILDPRALVVAAAADAGHVTVWRRPRVHVIASGDELVAPGDAAGGGAAGGGVRTPDSLSEAIQLLVRQWGGQPGGTSRVADDAAAITAAAEAALADCDVLVMAGGAARGERDLARAGLAPLGLDPVFAGVAMKPGKPVWYGRLSHRHVLGLPGNPTAAMTVARLFLVPLLTALEGRGFAAGLDWHATPLAAPVPAGDAREAFLCAARTSAGVEILDRQAASNQAMLARADLLVRRPPDAPALAAGALVTTLRF